MRNPSDLPRKALEGSLELAADTLHKVGDALQSSLSLPGLGKRRRAPRRPGGSPGIEPMPEIDRAPAPGTVRIQCIDYGPEHFESREVTDLDAFLSERRPPACAVRWINVDGLHPWTVNRIRQAFGLHTLAAEDVLNVPQRSKVEPYDAYLFLVTRMLEVRAERLLSEQISLFFWPDTLITLQEAPGDVWQPIRARLATPTSRLRAHNAAFLLYSLLDAITDTCFPILERYGDRLEELEDEAVSAPSTALLQRVHQVKRDLMLLRRVMWPMRQMADDLYRCEHPGIPPAMRAYLRDVHDHSMQILDILETYREMAAGLTELYMSSISNRMNEIMKVLTIMASLFIPITFLAGVYGMNFDHLPELAWPWAYYAFWAICIGAVAGMLVFFRRRGWLGGR